jgi:sodium/bile acid cotransporter 7
MTHASFMLPRMAQVHWVRSNGFVIALAAAVMGAFLLPGPGARNGFLHAEWVNNFGIALILFLQGLSLASETLRRSVGNWRLHMTIQSFTFVVFPIIGVASYFVLPSIWPGEPPAIRAGFLYLCVLPSTVSTSVVFTAVAGGNVPVALFNAALSNILGVFLTPVLIQLHMQTTGQSAPIGPLLLKILLLTLLPFFLGMGLRPALKTRVEPHRAWVPRISNTVVVFIVYTAFCDSVAQDVWKQHSAGTMARTIACVVLLFVTVSGLIALMCRAFRLERADAIAVYFCSVKKTLVMGVPLAALIFGTGPELSLILLPIMLYHPLQLLVNGFLANHWAKQVSPAHLTGLRK